MSARRMKTLAAPHRSVPVGGSKFHTGPNSTVLLPAQLTTGGVVSMTWTAWLQKLTLPQPSNACHVREADEDISRAPQISAGRRIEIPYRPKLNCLITRATHDGRRSVNDLDRLATKTNVAATV